MCARTFNVRGVHLIFSEKIIVLSHPQKAVEMSGERRQIIDPDAELEAIERLELPIEMTGADSFVASVLPEGLCRRLSPELDWSWVTGFRDSGVQFIIEKALPHFMGAARRNVPPNEAIFLALAFIRLGYPAAHIAKLIGMDSQLVTRAIQRGIDAIGRCFEPFTSFGPLPKLREIVEEEDLDKYPERALESMFVVDGKHFKGRIYGGLQKALSYYSHKLGTAAYQFQCVVLHSGFCVHVTDVEPAAMHDITVYKKSRPLLLAGLKAGGIEDPVILADKGYKAPDMPELFVPPEPKSIVNSNRLIVENYFGRMERVFASIRHRYRLALEHINLYVRALCFLTNYHIFLSPLRHNEHIFHRKLELYIINEAKRKRDSQRERMARKRESEKQAREISQLFGSSTLTPVSFQLSDLEHTPSKRSPTDNTNE